MFRARSSTQGSGYILQPGWKGNVPDLITVGSIYTHLKGQILQSRHKNIHSKDKRHDPKQLW